MGYRVKRRFIVLYRVVEQETEFVIRIAVAVKGKGQCGKQVAPAVILQVDDHVEPAGTQSPGQGQKTLDPLVLILEIADQQFIDMGIALEDIAAAAADKHGQSVAGRREFGAHGADRRRGKDTIAQSAELDHQDPAALHRFFVDFERPLDHQLHGETVLDLGERRFGHACGQRLILMDAHQGIGHGLGIGGRHEQAGYLIIDNIDHSSHRRGHDRHARSLGFDDHPAKSLLGGRGQDQRIKMLHDLRDIFLRTEEFRTMP